jgi:hypothetical protein
MLASGCDAVNLRVSRRCRVMDFELTEDQLLLRDSVRRLLAQADGPRSRCHPARARRTSLWPQFAARGLLGVGLPAKAGGRGGPHEIGVIMTELGRSLALEPFLSCVVLCGGLIRDYGTVAQRAQLLPRIVTGTGRFALAHQEEGSRHVLEYIGTIARRARGSYVLDGAKSAVLDAPLADGLAPGVRLTPYEMPDGRPAANIDLREVRVLTAARLGPPGLALAALERAADVALAASGAEAVGVIEAASESRAPLQSVFLMALQAKSMSHLATVRCRHPDRAERRRALTAARAYIGETAAFVAGYADPAQGRLVVRLRAIQASFAVVDPRPRALRDCIPKAVRDFL